jgi:hypothetical protein
MASEFCNCQYLWSKVFFLWLSLLEFILLLRPNHSYRYIRKRFFIFPATLSLVQDRKQWIVISLITTFVDLWTGGLWLNYMWRFWYIWTVCNIFKRLKKYFTSQVLTIAKFRDHYSLTKSNQWNMFVLLSW